MSSLTRLALSLRPSVPFWRSYTTETVQSSALPVSKLPYYVKRTSNRMLPVYSEVRNSGTRRLTIIQRIEGDSQKLQQDLAKTFKGTQVWVKPTNGHVILKGRYGRYVKSWLTARGF